VAGIWRRCGRCSVDPENLLPREIRECIILFFFLFFFFFNFISLHVWT
jgi:hypothetical protein